MSDAVLLSREETPFRRFAREFAESKLALAGLVVVVVIALLALFACGFLELSFNSMAQTLVQLNAPTDMRGRVIGLFNMASMGMRAGAGLTVGLLGSAIGIHWSLSLAAGALMGVISVLFLRLRRRTAAERHS